MNLQAYLDRIGVRGPVRRDLATLKAVHRAHAMTLAYENLDVQLRRPVTTDPAAAFDKIVTCGRGGWCYEMNGLLGWALGEIGFPVTRLAGGVHRLVRGDAAVGNHLVLKVDVEDEVWIADVGFGDGSRDPFPLREGAIVSDGYEYGLARLDDRWWRLTNHPLGGAPNFDFTLEPASEELLAAKCEELQTSPESIFVMTAICQRHVREEIRMLRGRAFRRIRPGVKEDNLIPDAAAFVTLLKREYDLDLPEAETLWPNICERHEQLFAGQAA